MRRSSQSIKAPYGSRGQRLASVDTGIRRVAPTFGKALYQTYSTKSTGELVESDEERLVAHMLTLDPRVRAFKSQPFKVDLIDRLLLQTPEAVAEARLRHKGRLGPKFYTPDFAVDRHSAPRSAIEVKREGHAGDDDYKSVLERAAQILESAGYLFSIAMMPASPHPLRSNLPLLKKAASRHDLWPSPDWVQKIEAVCAGRHITLRALCAELGLSPSHVPALLVSGAVSADVASHAIWGEMVLAPALGDLSHLELLEQVTL
ncbi:TnsA endonuclease N-terminal domain-containing protein [Paraburkholderia atlantica]|uniref:TnsA endonuclease N-terminal domain-containing protein n=1 Tax=Paraburkholderia atlantica TaxID=2654982 RepID=UPI001612D6D1|nr:TnsA endonuclease N-terminal domain-containing protein [Paraburkholderia atlantica]MBB5417070.1 hypothetical protein [Paraburkholderia atlantica]